MKHLFVVLALAAWLVSCGDNSQEKERLELMEASRQELATAVAERDRLLELVREISESMEQIKRLESVLTLSEAQSKEKVSERRRILADIESLRQTLVQRRRQLAELEENLKKSALYTDGLQASIDAMHRQIDLQAREIDGLRSQLSAANERIGSLNERVDSLAQTVAATANERDSAQEAASRLEDELNTCYYLAAGKGLLKKHKIIETGFLRKTKLMKGDFDKGVFTVGDKRALHSLDLGRGKAKVLTTHPSESYEISDSSGWKSLRILSVDDFWSLGNYLVVEID